MCVRLKSMLCVCVCEGVFLYVSVDGCTCGCACGLVCWCVQACVYGCTCGCIGVCEWAYVCEGVLVYTWGCVGVCECVCVWVTRVQVWVGWWGTHTFANHLSKRLPLLRRHEHGFSHGSLDCCAHWQIIIIIIIINHHYHHHCCQLQCLWCIKAHRWLPFSFRSPEMRRPTPCASWCVCCRVSFATSVPSWRDGWRSSTSRKPPRRERSSSVLLHSTETAFRTREVHESLASCVHCVPLRWTWIGTHSTASWLWNWIAKKQNEELKHTFCGVYLQSICVFQRGGWGRAVWTHSWHFDETDVHRRTATSGFWRVEFKMQVLLLLFI